MITQKINTPIHCAALDGNAKTIRLLYEHDNLTLTESVNRGGDTPLHLTAGKGRVGAHIL